MHVCFVFHSQFPNTFSTAIQETVRHLADRMEVTVVAAGESRETVRWEGATVHRLESDTSTAKSIQPTLFGIAATRLIGRIHSDRPIDIVHLHAFPALGLILTTPLGIPVIADVRGTAVSHWVLEALSRLGLRLQRQLVDEMVTVSRPVARHIFGTDEDIPIFPLGVDLDRFDPTTVIPIERDSDGTLAIYTGHLHPARNLSTLLEGVSIAAEGVQDLECVILGDGAARNDLQSRATELGIGDQVEFVGAVPHEDIPRWLAAADIGLGYVTDKPQYRHQPPIKTVEYLATGLPVVGTSTVGNRQFVGPDQGVLTPDTPEAFGNGLRKVGRRLGEFPSDALRESVARYDYEYIVENDLLPIYKENRR